jgi:hypothetical protein
VVAEVSIKALVSVIAAVLAAGITVTVVVIHVTAGPARSAASFCNVYFQQKRQYLTTYDSRNYSNDPLGGLLNAIGAMSDWVPMFEKLDAVAPPDIEPDVATVVDSLKQEQQAAGQELSNPLSALGSGLTAALMSSASWDHLDQYIQQNCHGG